MTDTSMKSSHFNANPDSKFGFDTESDICERMYERLKRDYPNLYLVHSLCSNKDVHSNGVDCCVVETPTENAKHGDIRIYKIDDKGRPLFSDFICIDVKSSRKWFSGSITFKKLSSDPKMDAIKHICDFIGTDVEDTFWYMSIGRNYIPYMIPLKTVKTFFRTRSTEDLLKICKVGKYDNGESWYMSLGYIPGEHKKYEEWYNSSLKNWVS